MSANRASPEPHTGAGQPVEDAHYYRQILHELIDMGADLARSVHQHATSQPAQPTTEPTPDASPDPTIAFDRIARAIRRTITLARHLAEPAPTPASHAPHHRAAARKRIIREVEDAIQRAAKHPEAESLQAEFLDRLDAPDLDDDIEQRPIADIIADICRDLGIAAPAGTQPWKRRTPADVAALCIRATTPSSLASRASPSVVDDKPAQTRPSSDPPSSPAASGATTRPSNSRIVDP